VHTRELYKTSEEFVYVESLRTLAIFSDLCYSADIRNKRGLYYVIVSLRHVTHCTLSVRPSVCRVTGSNSRKTNNSRKLKI